MNARPRSRTMRSAQAAGPNGVPRRTLWGGKREGGKRAENGGRKTGHSYLFIFPGSATGADGEVEAQVAHEGRNGGHKRGRNSFLVVVPAGVV